MAQARRAKQVADSLARGIGYGVMLCVSLFLISFFGRLAWLIAMM